MNRRSFFGWMSSAAAALATGLNFASPAKIEPEKYDLMAEIRKVSRNANISMLYGPGDLLADGRSTYRISCDAKWLTSDELINLYSMIQYIPGPTGMRCVYRMTTIEETETIGSIRRHWVKFEIKFEEMV